MSKPATAPPSSLARTVTRAVFSEYFVLVLALLFLLGLTPLNPVILSPGNLGNVLSNLFPLLVVAIGQTVVLIVAGIDLSQPSVIGISSVIGAALMAGPLNPVQLEGSPLWGSVISARGGLFAGQDVAVPVAVLGRYLYASGAST